jgi:hypothetical protein
MNRHVFKSMVTIMSSVRIDPPHHLGRTCFITRVKPGDNSELVFNLFQKILSRHVPALNSVSDQGQFWSLGGSKFLKTSYLPRLRIITRLDPGYETSAPLVYYKRWLNAFNGAPSFRWDLKKNEVSCHGRCGTIMIPPSSKPLSIGLFILQPLTGNGDTSIWSKQ